MFFKRSSENKAHDPPPGLLAVPLTDKVSVGTVVAMPTLPLASTVMRELPATRSKIWKTRDPLLVEISVPMVKMSPLVLPVNLIWVLSLLPARLPFKRNTVPVALLEEFCCTSSAKPGDAVPAPTLPEALISTLLVGAPGRIRKGRRDPLVTSRTKKFASFPATSQVCAAKPPGLFCSEGGRES